MEQTPIDQEPKKQPNLEQPVFWKKYRPGILAVMFLVLLAITVLYLQKGKSSKTVSNIDPYNRVVVVTDPNAQNPSEPQVNNYEQNSESKTEVVVNVNWLPELKEISCGSAENDRGQDCFLVGKITNTEFVGQDLVISLEYSLGTNISYSHISGDDETKTGVFGNNYKFKGIDDVPEKLAIPGSSYLLRKAYRQALFDPKQIKFKIFEDPKLGPVYLMDNGCIMVKLPDHTALAYDIELPFIEAGSGKLSLTFLDGKINTESYQYNEIVGCGALCYYLAVTDETILQPQSRLKIVGQTVNGDNMYEFSDPNAKELKDLYNDKNTMAYLSSDYQAQSKSKYTYQEFLNLKPLLYWKDPLGRWIRFKNQQLIPAAEMCKPVIYLYPKKATELTVKVYPNGGFTYTDPKYENGWKVLAEPSGRITDLRTGKKYPYLFWEGIGLNFPITEQGFVVSKEGLEEFFNQVMPKLGLNKNEQNDFSSYWLGRLNEFPFYKINFLKQEQFNEIAPLEFLGQTPDSFIRVMMVAKGLAHSESLDAPELPAPQDRTGFSFVEWGGVVLK